MEITEHVQVGARRVTVRVGGNAGADRTVLLLHPAPGSSAFDPDPSATTARGVRLLSLDRPGYGGSDPHDGPVTVVSAAADAAAVIDRYADGQVGVAGWSAGGRVALALAAKRPEVAGRVAILGTPAPQEEVPWVPERVAAVLEGLRGLPPGPWRRQPRN